MMVQAYKKKTAKKNKQTSRSHIIKDKSNTSFMTEDNGIVLKHINNEGISHELQNEISQKELADDSENRRSYLHKQKSKTNACQIKNLIIDCVSKDSNANTDRDIVNHDIRLSKNDYWRLYWESSEDYFNENDDLKETSKLCCDRQSAFEVGRKSKSHIDETIIVDDAPTELIKTSSGFIDINQTINGRTIISNTNKSNNEDAINSFANEKTCLNVQKISDDITDTNSSVDFNQKSAYDTQLTDESGFSPTNIMELGINVTGEFSGRKSQSHIDKNITVDDATTDFSKTSSDFIDINQTKNGRTNISNIDKSNNEDVIDSFANEKTCLNVQEISDDITDTNNSVDFIQKSAYDTQLTDEFGLCPTNIMELGYVTGEIYGRISESHVDKNITVDDATTDFSKTSSGFIGINQTKNGRTIISNTDKSNNEDVIDSFANEKTCLNVQEISDDITDTNNSADFNQKSAYDTQLTDEFGFSPSNINELGFNKTGKIGISPIFKIVPEIQTQQTKQNMQEHIDDSNDGSLNEGMSHEFLTKRNTTVIPQHNLCYESLSSVSDTDLTISKPCEILNNGNFKDVNNENFILRNSEDQNCKSEKERIFEKKVIAQGKNSKNKSNQKIYQEKSHSKPRDQKTIHRFPLKVTDSTAVHDHCSDTNKANSNETNYLQLVPNNCTCFSSFNKTYITKIALAEETSGQISQVCVTKRVKKIQNSPLQSKFYEMSNYLNNVEKCPLHTKELLDEMFQQDNFGDSQELENTINNLIPCEDVQKVSNGSSFSFLQNVDSPVNDKEHAQVIIQQENLKPVIDSDHKNNEMEKPYCEANNKIGVTNNDNITSVFSTHSIVKESFENSDRDRISATNAVHAENELTNVQKSRDIVLHSTNTITCSEPVKLIAAETTATDTKSKICLKGTSARTFLRGRRRIHEKSKNKKQTDCVNLESSTANVSNAKSSIEGKNRSKIIVDKEQTNCNKVETNCNEVQTNCVNLEKSACVFNAETSTEKENRNRQIEDEVKTNSTTEQAFCVGLESHVENVSNVTTNTEDGNNLNTVIDNIHSLNERKIQLAEQTPITSRHTESEISFSDNNSCYVLAEDNHITGCPINFINESVTSMADISNSQGSYRAPGNIKETQNKIDESAANMKRTSCSLRCKESKITENCTTNPETGHNQPDLEKLFTTHASNTENDANISKQSELTHTRNVLTHLWKAEKNKRFQIFPKFKNDVKRKIAHLEKELRKNDQSYVCKLYVADIKENKFQTASVNEHFGSELEVTCNYPKAKCEENNEKKIKSWLQSVPATNSDENSILLQSSNISVEVSRDDSNSFYKEQSLNFHDNVKETVEDSVNFSNEYEGTVASASGQNLDNRSKISQKGLNHSGSLPTGSSEDLNFHFHASTSPSDGSSDVSDESGDNYSRHQSSTCLSTNQESFECLKINRDESTHLKMRLDRTSDISSADISETNGNIKCIKKMVSQEGLNHSGYLPTGSSEDLDFHFHASTSPSDGSSGTLSTGSSEDPNFHFHASTSPSDGCSDVSDESGDNYSRYQSSTSLSTSQESFECLEINRDESTHLKMRFDSTSDIPSADISETNGNIKCIKKMVSDRNLYKIPESQPMNSSSSNSLELKQISTSAKNSNSNKILWKKRNKKSELNKKFKTTFQKSRKFSDSASIDKYFDGMSFNEQEKFSEDLKILTNNCEVDQNKLQDTNQIDPIKYHLICKNLELHVLDSTPTLTIRLVDEKDDSKKTLTPTWRRINSSPSSSNSSINELLLVTSMSSSSSGKTIKKNINISEGELKMLVEKSDSKNTSVSYVAHKNRIPMEDICAEVLDTRNNANLIDSGNVISQQKNKGYPSVRSEFQKSKNLVSKHTINESVVNDDNIYNENTESVVNETGFDNIGERSNGNSIDSENTNKVSQQRSFDRLAVCEFDENDNFVDKQEINEYAVNDDRVTGENAEIVIKRINILASDSFDNDCDKVIDIKHIDHLIDSGSTDKVSQQQNKADQSAMFEFDESEHFDNKHTKSESVANDTHVQDRNSKTIIKETELVANCSSIKNFIEQYSIGNEVFNTDANNVSDTTAIKPVVNYKYVPCINTENDIKQTEVASCSFKKNRNKTAEHYSIENKISEIGTNSDADVNRFGISENVLVDTDTAVIHENDFSFEAKCFKLICKPSSESDSVEIKFRKIEGKTKLTCKTGHKKLYLKMSS